MEGSETEVRPPRRTGRRRAARHQLGADSVAGVPVREALLERPGATGLDPMGQLDEQAGARPFVGIFVEGDVETGRPRVLDERERGLGPGGDGRAVTEVGDVSGGRSPPADLDRLPKRIEVPVAERI